VEQKSLDYKKALKPEAYILEKSFLVFGVFVSSLDLLRSLRSLSKSISETSCAARWARAAQGLPSWLEETQPCVGSSPIAAKR
jgi:hypothetical protein